ncbi:hypothetical protein JTB14_036817 [Gonioctena quinquepunctata]|nr:hypothetical protein JTB14_036817 [Gonioctena quinquepunctata]
MDISSDETQTLEVSELKNERRHTCERAPEWYRLRLLSKNYLSKTKYQKIAANLNFLDGVLFEDDVCTPKVILKGELNDVKISDLPKNILLHRPQLFEDQLYFEDITAKRMNGNYLVNKFNLESDVMRYDKAKYDYRCKKDVDVNYWLTNAILRSTGSFSITGKKYFRNATMKEGLSLLGHWNDIKINKDTVLLKTTPQNITGRKVFSTNFPEELNFKALKVKGLVNDADIGELIDNQVSKNDDILIRSSMNFHGDISAHNVNLKNDTRVSTCQSC